MAPTASASTNHIFLATGDAPNSAAFDKAEVKINEMIGFIRACASQGSPLETCQCVASFDKIKGELTLWGTFQAPHVIRTVGSLDRKSPSTRFMSRRISAAGFGNKVGAWSGLSVRSLFSIVTVSR